MKQYQVISGAYGCDVQLTYNENGTLVKYEVMNPSVESKVGKITLSMDEADFLKIMKGYNMKVTEVHREITFEMFWDRYGHKVSKQDAKQLWDKLSKDNRVKAFDYIWKYERMLSATSYGRQKKDPDGYLRKQMWNDNS